MRSGFARMPGFLRPDEINGVRAEVERALAAPRLPGCERLHNTLIPLRWNDDLVDRVLSSADRMGAVVAAVGADDPRWISGYVSLKEPGSGPLWWHQDWWCWDHHVSYRRTAAQVAVLCYLAGTDESNGALRVLPGSHHRSIPLHAALPEAHAHEPELDGRHVAMRDAAGQVTLPARPGDAVVLDYRLLHGTHSNGTASRRDCLVLTFAPSWRRLPADIRAHLIRHPAQPAGSEQRPRAGWQRRLLPRFDGTPRDLDLNRVAPAEFSVHD
jgi:ectoine hydroxylase-related dioxygenase (phytanoyl-CoA dioxygenase family)